MKLLTKAEICRALGISERGLAKMVAERRFPQPVRLGGLLPVRWTPT